MEKSVHTVDRTEERNLSVADSEREPSDDVVEHDEVGGTRARPTRASIATVALLVVVVLIACAVGLTSALQARSASADRARDHHLLEVASAMSVNLVTLGQDSAEADLERVINGTTGDFREQFVSAFDSFGSLLEDGGVESVGEVKSAGIAESGDDSATVLAAVTSTVKNNEAPDGEVRVYRMKLFLDDVDGTWLVSNVEFVA